MIFRSLRFLGIYLAIMNMASCSFYSLSNTSIPENVNTFEVRQFGYTATQTEVGIERQFTNRLADFIKDQSRLTLVANNGDYLYDGEITRYFISPITATADNRASQNRLTIAVNVRFINTVNDVGNFEKPYSFYYDYGADTILQGNVLDEALDVIYTQITQDITNDSLSSGWN